jgi:putative ABC transport system substrate-binding protein
LFGSTVAAWPMAARAQQTDRARRLAIINPNSGDLLSTENLAFRRALQRLGWRDAENIQIDYAHEREDPEAAAVRLLAFQPDVILTVGVEVLEALQRHTQTAPIVFTIVSDPLGSGFVKSLARPGGNVTGFMNFEYSILGKWIAILKEIVPQISHAAVIEFPGKPTLPGYERELHAAIQSLGIPIALDFVHDTADIERSVKSLAIEPKGGLIVMPDIITNTNRQFITGLAAQHGIPAVYPYRLFAVAGGLVSYGVDRVEIMRKAATYVDRILRGESVGDLPVQAPTKFELVVNLKAAKAVGLTIPEFFLLRADEVIE